MQASVFFVGLGFRVLGGRVQNLGFRGEVFGGVGLSGLGYRVKGLGFRVIGLN